jgi:hypothetical protein
MGALFPASLIGERTVHGAEPKVVRGSPNGTSTSGEDRDGWDVRADREDRKDYGFSPSGRGTLRTPSGQGDERSTAGSACAAPQLVPFAASRGA